MRLAFFGGSFDPPHRGHLTIALAAADQLSLDRVLLAPTGRQPLKRGGASAGFADRLAMVDLLCQSRPDCLTSSDLDAPNANGCPNYTVDALRALRQHHPEAELFALVGADNLSDLPKWHAAPQLVELAAWIAISRPGHPFPAVLPRPLDDALARRRLYLVSNVDVPLSSTELRRRLHRGEDCREMIPETVLGYIQAHRLYTEPASEQNRGSRRLR